VKRRIFLVFAALAAATMLSAGPALAVLPGTQDQHQDTSGGNSAAVLGSGQMDGQLFTSGVTGNLVAVEFYVDAIATRPAVVGPNLADSATVSIRNVASGHPDVTSLGGWHGTLTGDTWNGIVLDAPVALVAGTQYAIVFTPDVDQQLTLGGSCNSADYTGGSAMVYDTAWESVPTYNDGACIQQWAFRTRMTTATAPPTSTVASSSTPANGTALPLLIAGAFGVLAFVTLRRTALARR
jgi:hypothetical protein